MPNQPENKEKNIFPEQMPFLKFGRPDIRILCQQIREEAIKAQINRVAVFVCGL